MSVFAWPSNFSQKGTGKPSVEEEKETTSSSPAIITTTSSPTTIISTTSENDQPFVSRCISNCLSHFSTAHLLELRKSYRSKSEAEKTKYLVTMRKCVGQGSGSNWTYILPHDSGQSVVVCRADFQAVSA